MTPREHAAALYNRARELAGKDDLSAYRLLASSVESDPGFAEGWSFLGAVCADLGSLPASIAAYRSALRCPEDGQPGSLTAYGRVRNLLQLGHRLLNYSVVCPRNIEEAKTALEACLSYWDDIDLTDDLVAPMTAIRGFAYTNLALASSFENNEFDEYRFAEMGHAVCPDPMTELGLAFGELFTGRYRSGLEHFESRFPMKLPQYLNYPYPRWAGGSVDKLFVASEQGLGDSLSFARFIEPASQVVGELTFSVQPELAGLLHAAFAHLTNVKVVPQSHVFGDFNAWCPMFSLPVPLNLNDEQIARWPGVTLKVRPVEDLSWKKKGARHHIAIAWAGSPGNGIDGHRSIPFHAFLRLRDIPGVALYSVQVGERCRDLHDAGGAALIRDLAPWVRDSRDTAGILNEMTCVVACESFVAHLAGALDKKCFVLCSRYGRDWRSSPYLGERVLWYPETTPIRQTERGKWDDVFDEVVRRLS